MRDYWAFRCAAMLAVAACIAAAPASAQSDYSAEALKADLKLFEDAKLPHGNKDLLALFQNRVPSDKDCERIAGLIKQFGNTSYKEREQARVAVEKEGPKALPQLREVLRGQPELEVRLRTELCIKAIEEKSPTALVLAAARLIMHARAEGAAAVLLEYVGFAPDNEAEEEICAGIYALAMNSVNLEILPPAVRAGILEPGIMNALADKQPIRRAVAALAAIRFGRQEERTAAAKLVQDEAPIVRLRAAQGLVMAGEKKVIPVLVDLLGSGPMDVACLAETLLSQIAEGEGPSAVLEESKAVRQKCFTAWKQWSEKNEESLDLSKVAMEPPFNSPATQARNAALQLSRAMAQGNFDLMKRLTDAPFRLNSFVINTREELNGLLNSCKDQAPQVTLKQKVIKVVPAKAYAKHAQEDERTFLEAMGQERIHVVFVSVQWGTADSVTIPTYIRIVNGEARSIGEGKYVHPAK